MKPLTFAAFGAALLLGAGCAERAPSVQTTSSAPSAPLAVEIPPPENQCGAAEIQSFVGKPAASLPPTPEGAIRRVICWDCAHTEDFRPERQSIQLDEAENILSISCG